MTEKNYIYPMQDLLKEEDFNEIKEFRLLRHILIYSLIITVQLILLFVPICTVDQETAEDFLYYSMRIWVVLNVFLPFVFAFMMVFLNKKMTFLPLKTIFLSLLCLAVTYVFGLLMVSIFDAKLNGRTTGFKDFLIPVCVGGVLLFLFTVLILPIANHKQKSKI